MFIVQQRETTINFFYQMLNPGLAVQNSERDIYDFKKIASAVAGHCSTCRAMSDEIFTSFLRSWTLFCWRNCASVRPRVRRYIRTSATKYHRKQTTEPRNDNSGTLRHVVVCKFSKKSSTSLTFILRSDSNQVYYKVHTWFSSRRWEIW